MGVTGGEDGIMPQRPSILIILNIDREWADNFVGSFGYGGVVTEEGMDHDVDGVYLF